MLGCVSGTAEAILTALTGWEGSLALAVTTVGPPVREAQGPAGLRLVVENVMSMAVVTNRPARSVLESGWLLLESGLLHDVAWTSDESGTGSLPVVALATRTVLVDGLRHCVAGASDALHVVGAGVASVWRLAPWPGVA